MNFIKLKPLSASRPNQASNIVSFATVTAYHIPGHISSPQKLRNDKLGKTSRAKTKSSPG
jgi:hypothetical protein